MLDDISLLDTELARRDYLIGQLVRFYGREKNELMQRISSVDVAQALDGFSGEPPRALWANLDCLLSTAAPYMHNGRTTTNEFLSVPTDTESLLKLAKRENVDSADFGKQTFLLIPLLIERCDAVRAVLEELYVPMRSGIIGQETFALDCLVDAGKSMFQHYFVWSAKKQVLSIGRLGDDPSSIMLPVLYDEAITKKT